MTEHAVVAQPNTLADARYLAYLLKRMNLYRLQAQSAQPGLSVKTLSVQEIRLPHLEIQRRVSSILSAIDDKIELNNEINRNLEEQARLIYEDMFLNGSIAKRTSGTLSDIAEITMGQSPKGNSYNETGIGEVFYQGRAEFGFRFPTRRLYTTEPKRMAEKGDILLSVRAPVGDYNIAMERCCIGRGLAAIHSKTEKPSFLLYSVLALQKKLDVFNGEGTIFGSINKDALNELPLNIPDSSEIDRFEELVRPMDKLIWANCAENQRLQALRDTLLPKLMSGELDISEVKI